MRRTSGGLEALRRAGIAERLHVEDWEIPTVQAASYDKQHGCKLVVEVHSAVDLDRQITADAATWLNRELLGRHRVEAAPGERGATGTTELLLFEIGAVADVCVPSTFDLGPLLGERLHENAVHYVSGQPMGRYRWRVIDACSAARSIPGVADADYDAGSGSSWRDAETIYRKPGR